VVFDSETPGTFYHLSAQDSDLWSIGPKDLFALSANNWRTLAQI